MTARIVVAGTDTDVGKTVFAAALVRALDGYYWKPVQAGLSGETDRDIVERLSGLAPGRMFAEAYRLATPASPHIAADRDGIVIDIARLTPPPADRPLVIELAGGLAVPLTRRVLQIDVVSEWRAPVVLCASTRLGTINHSLLSIEALKRRAIPILGIAFIGAESLDVQQTISRMGGVRPLGRLPELQPLNAQTLAAAFAASFDVADILGLGAKGP